MTRFSGHRHTAVGIRAVSRFESYSGQLVVVDGHDTTARVYSIDV